MTNIEQAMDRNPRDFSKWDVNMQQLKGTCSSIGACRMKNECTSFRNRCGDENVEGSLTLSLPGSYSVCNFHFDFFFCCMRSFQNLKREHGVLRQKLESYFQLLRQAGPAVTATRPRGM
ncbi:hypothetical protein Zm00014a_031951 [Zea mays]|nr:hypothetical protein Zm00014a_031951 [Zea mays]PWZ11735.1 hypothetical protein Zm00014a_031951 [Zea mays]